MVQKTNVNTSLPPPAPRRSIRDLKPVPEEEALIFESQILESQILELGESRHDLNISDLQISPLGATRNLKSNGTKKPDHRSTLD